MEDVSRIFSLCSDPSSGVVVLVGYMIVALMLFSVGVYLFSDLKHKSLLLILYMISCEVRWL